MPRPKKQPLSPHQSDDKRISTEWLHGLSPEEALDFERTWRNSTYVLDRMKLILERKIRDLEFDKQDDYNNPQWPVLRADKNGEYRVLKTILRLLP